MRHVVIVALLTASVALAQERPFASAVPDVRPGMRVRALVVPHSEWQLGRVTSVSSTRLVLTLSAPESPQLAIPLTDLVGLERRVQRDRFAYGGLGAVAGLISGAFLGVGLGLAIGEPDRDGTNWAALGFGLAGSVVGTVVGTVVGVNMAPGDWVSVKPRR